MPTWDQLFLAEENRKKFPEPEVFKFAEAVESTFSERPLRIWDVCCGAGRHTVALSALGHEVYASDIAPNGVRLTREWLETSGHTAKLEVSDMTECPWPEVTFHGAMSWDALHHNTIENIQKAIDCIHGRLLEGGFLVCTLKSTQADLFGRGKEVEPNTFVSDEGAEAGVPHHYFDEPGIRSLFKKWELVALAEQVISYKVRGDNFLPLNPFPYTTWGVMARRA